MIGTFIVLLFSNLWAIAFQYFPTGHLPAGVSSAISTAIGWLYVINPFVDVALLLSLFKVVLSFELAFLGVQFFFWVYAKIPIFGKR